MCSYNIGLRPPRAKAEPRALAQQGAPIGASDCGVDGAYSIFFAQQRPPVIISFVHVGRLNRSTNFAFFLSLTYEAGVRKNSLELRTSRRWCLCGKPFDWYFDMP